jgi:hypothetical protein
MEFTRDNVLDAIRDFDEGRGWVRQRLVVQQMGGGRELIALIQEMAALGEIVRQTQIWSQLNENLEPIGEPMEVALLRLRN